MAKTWGGPYCGKCRYYVGDSKSGFCYRAPPVPVSSGPQITSFYPPVRVDWGCGEHMVADQVAAPETQMVAEVADAVRAEHDVYNTYVASLSGHADPD